MKTAATEMLGIEFPIFAFSHCRDVVAAVSKAGGLGVLGAVAHSPEQLEIDLNWIEDEIGDRPYGVDLIVPAKYAGDEGGGVKGARRAEGADAQPLHRLADAAVARREGRGREVDAHVTRAKLPLQGEGDCLHLAGGLPHRGPLLGRH
jgi:NAD(P)H-dependent flavin oxidoreductase YrpB (nitropropane dioxygenase family)